LYSLTKSVTVDVGKGGDVEGRVRRGTIFIQLDRDRLPALGLSDDVVDFLDVVGWSGPRSLLSRVLRMSGKKGLAVEEPPLGACGVLR
jgi:hypothetical protein